MHTLNLSLSQVMVHVPVRLRDGPPTFYSTQVANELTCIFMSAVSVHVSFPQNMVTNSKEPTKVAQAVCNLKLESIVMPSW